MTINSGTEAEISGIRWLQINKKPKLKLCKSAWFLAVWVFSFLLRAEIRVKIWQQMKHIVRYIPPIRQKWPVTAFLLQHGEKSGIVNFYVRIRFKGKQLYLADRVTLNDLLVYKKMFLFFENDYWPHHEHWDTNLNLVFHNLQYKLVICWMDFWVMFWLKIPLGARLWMRFHIAFLTKH